MKDALLRRRRLLPGRGTAGRRPTATRTLVWALLLATALTGCGTDTRNDPPAPEPSGGQGDLATWLPDRPGTNILVISFDALRADALGLYGHPNDISPNIDAFGAKSLVFDHAYTAGNVTPTSFAGAFSGKIPLRVFRKWHFDDHRTLAKTLAEAGYTTAAFLNNVQLVTARGFDLGFQSFNVDPEQRTLDRENLRHAEGWLEGHQKERFFLWVHFINPHSPYDRRDLASRFYDASYRGPFKRTTGSSFHPTNPEDVARVRSLYDGEVFFADNLFGQLIQRVRDLGLWDSTVIILTADHGEEFGERGAYQHEHLHEETVRIPLVIHSPGSPRAGRTPLLVSNIDLYPTLAAISGHPLHHEVDGRDIRSLEASRPRDLVSVAMTASEYRAIALRTASNRLILDCKPKTEIELFDLASDPAERQNLAPKQQRLVVRLARALQRDVGADPCDSIARAVAGVAPTAGLADENVRALEALGYVDQ